MNAAHSVGVRSAVASCWFMQTQPGQVQVPLVGFITVGIKWQSQGGADGAELPPQAANRSATAIHRMAKSLTLLSPSVPRLADQPDDTVDRANNDGDVEDNHRNARRRAHGARKLFDSARPVQPTHHLVFYEIPAPQLMLL